MKPREVRRRIPRNGAGSLQGMCSSMAGGPDREYSLAQKTLGAYGQTWQTCSHVRLSPVRAEKFYKIIIELHCLKCGCYLQYSLALKISLCHEIVLSIVFYCLTVAVLGRIWSVGRLKLGSSWTSLLVIYADAQKKRYSGLLQNVKVESLTTSKTLRNCFHFFFLTSDS